MQELQKKLESSGYASRPEVLSAVLDAVYALKAHNLSDGDLRLSMEILSVSGYQELLEFRGYSEEDWQDFDYGNVKPGSYVRVKPDSYDSETGKSHNGRVGILLNISGRRCTVRYLGTKGATSMKHPISNLQSLKYGVE